MTIIRSPSTLLAAALLAVVMNGPARADTVTLKETGSTLILPLFQVWASDYAKTHDGVTVTTAGTGSAAGIDQAVANAVQIGTSDAYMSDDQVRQNPDILNVPMAVSAQTINYNLPDLKQVLKLDGPTLAGIYDGTIRSWDDKAIAALNPGVSLPHHDIVPVHRAEGSGDTFIFSQYLSFTTSTRQDDVGTTFQLPNSSWSDKVGYGTSVTWPQVAAALEAKGNDGMLATIAKTPYAIGYIGVSFAGQVADAKLGTAEMKSYSGQFLLPTPETIAAAAASLGPRTPDDERLTLVNAPGDNCYPLINYEYAIVSKTQASPAMAAAIRNFLLWAIAPDEANEARLDAQHFIALPAHIWVKSHDQLEDIR